MLRVQQRPASEESEHNLDAVGKRCIQPHGQCTVHCLLSYHVIYDTSSKKYLFTVREDLLRLQREYRVTEGKRKFTSDQAQNAIRKQRYCSTAYELACSFSVACMY